MSATPFIWKAGFPLDVSEPEATAAAVAAVTRHYADQGHQVSEATTSILRTPEHTAAGEYLVRVAGTYTVDGGV